MNNLQENLLGGKGKKQSKEYKRKFEECENKVKMLRNKNNELQRQNDNQLDCDIRLAIKQQMTFIKKEIQSIKEMIEKLSKQYNDPASKNKIKQLWNMAAKEIQRNKRLMEDFVNRASSSRSFLNRQSQKANRKTKTQFQHQNVQKHKNKNKQNQEIKQSSILQSQDLITEINFQRKIQAQKNALLKQLQQKNYKINEIMNEMGRMVGEQQKDVIDVIQANNMTTKQNIEQSNDLLGNAIENQKKSQKKFICIVITIIIALLIAGGITYIIVNNN